MKKLNFTSYMYIYKYINFQLLFLSKIIQLSMEQSTSPYYTIKNINNIFYYIFLNTN